MNVRSPGVENSVTYMEEVARPLDGMKWLGIKNRSRQQQPRRHGDTVGETDAGRVIPMSKMGDARRYGTQRDLGQLVGRDVSIGWQQQGDVGG